MNEVFLRTLNMSISASWLVLAVLALRGLLKKAPKWIPVLLWGIVAIRLICPLSLESPLSLIPSTETIPLNIGLDPTPAIDSGIDVINNAVNPVISHSNTPLPGASANPLQITIGLLEALWIFGMIVLALYTAVSYWRLRCKVATAVRWQDNIFQSEHVASPFVLGLIKPRIYLPFHLDDQAMEHVIAHEQAHIRRKDHWWKPLGFLLLTIHWFNPLMWLAYVLLCRDIELACDEKVIKALGGEQRANYTQALVTCSVSRRRIAACPLAFGELSVKERVKTVMHYKKPGFWMIVVAVLVCAAVGVCFLTNPSQDTYDLRIVVPAGSQTATLYANEEISPGRGYVAVSCGDGLGDTEVVLEPVQSENAESQAAYLTPGMPVKLPAQRGQWYRVGVKVHNPSEQDIEVFLTVKHVVLRIANQAEPAQKWFDGLSATEERPEEGWQANLPAFPGVTFRCNSAEVMAVTENETVSLFQGMPIWNAYFCDLTGDGLPEICATYSFGSGVIDERMIVYDYANGASYELSDRGNYDFTLRQNETDGLLYVEKRAYNTTDLVATGVLTFRDACIGVDWVELSAQGEGGKYELTIGTEGVYRIDLALPHTSGGCIHADESPFRKGERVWLELLDGRQDLRGLTITALDDQGAILWSASVPDTLDSQDCTSLEDQAWRIDPVK